LNTFMLVSEQMKPTLLNKYFQRLERLTLTVFYAAVPIDFFRPSVCPSVCPFCSICLSVRSV